MGARRVGGGARRHRRAGARHPARPWSRRDRPLRRQPDRPSPRRDAHDRPADRGAGHAQPLLGDLARPAAAHAGGAAQCSGTSFCSRSPTSIARVLHVPRRQPAGLERQPHDRARHPRTAPGAARRGGRFVVVDPRRTETAAIADQHLFIRPGTDACLLLALVQVMFAEGRRAPGRLAPFTRRPRRAARAACRASRRAGRGRHRHRRPRTSAGSRASSPTRRARSSTAASALCTQEFGGLAAWLVYVRQRRHRQPRPRGRADVPDARRSIRCRSRPRRGCAAASTATARACANCPSSRGELPVGGAGRGDRDAGRRADPRADHARRQPGALGPERRRGSSARCPTSS